MKRKQIIVIAALFISMYAFPTSLQAKDGDKDPIRITNLDLQGGSPSFLGLWGELEYDTVCVTTTIAHHIDPATTESYQVITTTIVCHGKGDIKCHRTPSNCNTSLGHHTFPSSTITNIEDNLLDEIVNILLNPEKFQEKGSIGKKVIMVDNEGERGTFLFHARWNNATKEGDAKIHIEVYDITDDIDLKL